MIANTKLDGGHAHDYDTGSVNYEQLLEMSFLRLVQAPVIITSQFRKFDLTRLQGAIKTLLSTNA